MATWRLTGKHYLNVQNPEDPDNPVEWIYEETDQSSGRRLRKRFKVPMYLDPEDPVTCKFYGVNGELLVTRLGDKGPRGTLFFEGDPTPDMEPLDDEAAAISQECAEKRQDPMGEGALPGTGRSYGDRLFEQLSAQLNAVLTQTPIPKAAPAVAVNYVTQEQFAEMQKQMQAVLKRNEELEAALSEPELPITYAKPEPQGRRL